MLHIAGLGIAVLQAEGASAEAVAAADLLVPSVTAALDLFLQPRRLMASLRS
jgi:soluble P-type ATPase